MTYKQRMAQAWVNLNCFRWDNFIGDKPENWDDIPEYSETRPCKYNLIHVKFIEISNELGEKATSRAWWKYELKRSWLRWFIYWHFTRKRMMF